MCVKGTVLGLIYIVLQIIVVVFFILACPFETFRARSELYDDSAPASNATYKDRACFTVWNYRTVCGDKSSGESYVKIFDGKVAELIPETDVPVFCGKQRNYFILTAVFVCVSIVVGVLAVINGFCALLSCFQYKCCALIFAIMSAICTCVAWALLVSLYYQKMCGGTEGTASNGVNISEFQYKMDYKYGSSFILMVAGWCIQMVALIVVIAS